jgi:hypothetical protein
MKRKSADLDLKVMGANGSGSRPVTVTVIEHGRMPSTDYFVRPHVAQFGVPVRVIDSATQQADEGALGADALIVFVRYIAPEWARAVRAVRKRLAGVVLFMDDDLLDSGALVGLPMRYRYKIWRLTLRHKKWLEDIDARLWVSNEYLAGKYSAFDPLVIPATPSPDVLRGRPGVRIFYHGTASHAGEIRWLVPIVQEVQKQCDDSFFEISGGLDVNRLYRKIPRTHVLHPMSWPNYLAYTSLGGLQIGLAPLLPGRFSAGRSNTKFLDFVRCGAVGIYSDVAPYAGFVRHGVDGMLVRNEPEAWVETIVNLARNGEVRARMAQSAAQRLGVVGT